MKAIHNLGRFIPEHDKVGNYKLKYNFESNSQRFHPSKIFVIRW
nr:hypothetical protein [Flavobacterium psychrophilum]